MSVWNRELPPIGDKRKSAPTPPWEQAAGSTSQKGKTVKSPDKAHTTDCCHEETTDLTCPIEDERVYQEIMNLAERSGNGIKSQG